MLYLLWKCLGSDICNITASSEVNRSTVCCINIFFAVAVCICSVSRHTFFAWAPVDTDSSTALHSLKPRGFSYLVGCQRGIDTVLLMCFCLPLAMAGHRGAVVYSVLVALLQSPLDCAPLGITSCCRLPKFFREPVCL